MLGSVTKKYALLAAVLMVVLSGGAMAAKAADTPPPPDKKTESKDDKKPADKSENHYVKVAPLILPVIGDNGVEQIVSIIVVIEAQSQDTAIELADYVPRINDAFLTELYGSLDRRERMKNGLIDVGYLKQKMVDIAVRVAGKDRVKDVLIQGVSQHQS